MDSQVSKSGEVAIVNDASTFVVIGEVDKVKRWSKQEKEFIEVNRPEAIWIYKNYMGKLS